MSLLRLRLCAISAIAALAFSATLQASPTDYRFSIVADTSSGAFTGFGPPVINNAGTVVFPADLRSGAGGLFTGPNPDTDAIVTASPSLPVFQFALNNGGAVAFAQRFNDGSEAIVIHTSTGTIPVADTHTHPFRSLRELDINDAGTVAFVATLKSGAEGIFTGPNPGSDTVVDSNGPFQGAGSFAEPQINNAGTVVFDGKLKSGVSGIFRGPDPATDTIADTSGPYTFVSGATLNDSGKVLFNAFTQDADGLFTGPDPATDAFVDTSDPYRNFSFHAMNNADEAVFFGGIGEFATGLFTGPDPVSDEVITTGDTLFGNSVVELQISNHVLNDSGQIVFRYRLNDGREGIATASPAVTAIPLPAALPATLVLALPLGLRWIWRK